VQEASLKFVRGCQHEKLGEPLIGQKTRDGTCLDQLPGDTAEYPFTKSRATISAGDDQIGMLLFSKAKEDVALVRSRNRFDLSAG
jgi:hypothetical protein